MGTTLGAILIAATIALGVASFELWRRLRVAFTRIFDLERRLDDEARRLTTLSQAACTNRALHLGTTNGDPILCHSQHGEELLIWELLGWKREGFFIEIGAYDGLSLSNSAFFERIGWKGILVEAHPQLAERCRTNRTGSVVVHAALGDGTRGDRVSFSMVEGTGGMDTLSFADAASADVRRIERRGGRIEMVEVPGMTLDALLSARSDLPPIDFVSIDVEGAELQVLRGANLGKHRPQLLVLEDNSGGRDRAVANLLADHGYQSVRRCGCNEFYRLSS